MTAIKVCGLTAVAEAVECVRAGASHLGLNFHRHSVRCIDPALAAEIAAATREERADRVLVGVFVDEPLERVRVIERQVGLDALQFHGDQTPEELAPWGRRAWKVLSVSAGPELAEIARYPTVGAFLLDRASVTERGGTGLAWRYESARSFAEGARTWLAGGLGPDNVAAAVRAARPFGVDACSRLEAGPGRKDLDRVRRFIEEVRRAEV